VAGPAPRRGGRSAPPPRTAPARRFRGRGLRPSSPHPLTPSPPHPLTSHLTPARCLRGRALRLTPHTSHPRAAFGAAPSAPHLLTSYPRAAFGARPPPHHMLQLMLLLSVYEVFMRQSEHIPEPTVGRIPGPGQNTLKVVNLCGFEETGSEFKL